MRQADIDVTIYLHGIMQSHVRFWQFFARWAIWVFIIPFAVLSWGRSLEYIVTFFILPFFAAFATVLLIRFIARRPRPTEFTVTYKPWLHAWSFPSLHAASAFAAATICTYGLIDALPPDSGVLTIIVVVAYLLAGLISLSRVGVGVHYILDISIGGVLGAMIPYLLLAV